ncbi:ParA family protein [Deinococcus alpinitundrae]|uniref:ParA family protein n=1 Tax=Deinococcus alpinitundrae TaxID=468913 RepID=UPI00137B44A6|nr:ParA family protein [Deinococcus alpinitundrae]
MRSLALTSTKGGVGKSTLAFNLSGALAGHLQPLVLVDEDIRIHTCLTWAGSTVAGLDLNFRTVSPAQASAATQDAAMLVVDTEGRPELPDLVALTGNFDRVLIPCGVSGVEVNSTIELWELLGQAGADLSRVRVVITKAPPVGTLGQQAREALRELGVSACESVVRNYAAHQRAAELGMLVRDVPDKRALSAWADIEALASEVLA